MTAPRATPGWAVDGLDYPTLRLTMLAKQMDRLTMRQLAETGHCTYPEWRVLLRLGATPAGLTVKQIAAEAWVDRAEVSRAAAALEKRGLVARRDNAQDQRAPILFLTGEGVKLYRRNLAQRAAFHESLLAGLDEGERAAFDALLGKLAQRIGELA